MLLSMGIRDSAPLVLSSVIHGFIYSWLCEIFAHYSNVLIGRLKLVTLTFGCVWLVADNYCYPGCTRFLFHGDTEDVLRKYYN